jgi:hypothetical protein
MSQTNDLTERRSHNAMFSKRNWQEGEVLGQVRAEEVFHLKIWVDSMPSKIRAEFCSIIGRSTWARTSSRQSNSARRGITAVTLSTTVHLRPRLHIEIGIAALDTVPSLSRIFRRSRTPQHRQQVNRFIMVPVIGLSHITNPLATPDQLQTTASQLDRIPADLEVSIKFESSRLIQAAGILLHLPQELIAEVIIIFSRFWLGPEGGSLAEYAAKVCMLKDRGPDVAQVCWQQCHGYHHSAVVYAQVRVLLYEGTGLNIVDQSFCRILEMLRPISLHAINQKVSRMSPVSHPGRLSEPLW